MRHWLLLSCAICATPCLSFAEAAQNNVRPQPQILVQDTAHDHTPSLGLPDQTHGITPERDDKVQVSSAATGEILNNASEPLSTANIKPKKEKPIAYDPSNIGDANPSLTPLTLVNTQKLAESYKKLADRGGWKKVSFVNEKSKGAKVSALRERLAAEGDMTVEQARASDHYDAMVITALKRFQSRMGLPENGTLNPRTLDALNVPADQRARELTATALRLSQMRLSFAERYVVVNLPSARVEAVDHGQIVRLYDAIMGDADHQSPDVVARIQAVNLNPTWTVPASIVKNEIIPKMRDDKNYLSNMHIRILDAHNVEIKPETIDWTTDKATNYILRQDSGDHNSLGQIRINMPNRYAVYMHDTPAKHLFSSADHFLSHGCVRVKGVYDLAEWVLEKTPVSSALLTSPASSRLTTMIWTQKALHDQVATHESVEVRVSKEIPVMWVYMTGWAGSDGRAHFRSDVYHRDTEATATMINNKAFIIR
jgi:L,D-transpeptidase YcbB